MAIFNFTLPDLGEGLPDAEIVTWHVAIGDRVTIDQNVVSVETAKAIIDIPSPVNGVIQELCAQPGEVVATGKTLIVFAVDQQMVTSDLGTVVGKVQSSDQILNIRATGNSNSVNNTNNFTAKASPAVRALANKLQVNLNQLTPTGPNNTITLNDVEQAANFVSEQYTTTDGWQELHQTARSMALSMQKSHNEVVPATIFEDLILSSYSRFKPGKKFDITVNLIEAIAFAYAKEPIINSWIVQNNRGFKQKICKDLNLGIAVDSEEGLFVPVIKHAQQKSSVQLREEINLLLQQINDRNLKPEQLQQATFILSNFGKFTGRYAIPVIVPPMVGILAVGRMRQEMLVLGDNAKIGTVLPLSLTFDHRAVTGGQAARFLKLILQFFNT